MAIQTSPQASIRGQRVFTCGHSFHYWVGDIIAELAQAAGIDGHCAVGTSVLGGSTALRHWDVPDSENAAKKAIREGTLDVLTLSCMTQADDGIRKFAEFAVEHNSDMRVTLQELWLPEDRFPFDPKNRARSSVDEFNGSTMETLKPPHVAYFQMMEDYVKTLNDDLGQQTVFIVPDAQATLGLRERIIAGSAPGIERQSELFVDSWGHPGPVLKVLSGYCHFSVIYRRSAVGLSVPSLLTEQPNERDALNTVLQQLAWDAVTGHSMSGVDVCVESAANLA